MLEPVEIDINLKQNVSEEAPKATQASEEMTQEIARLEKVIKNLSTALEEQRKQAANNSDTSAKYASEIDKIQDSLRQANRKLEIYQELLERADKATKEGANTTEVLVEAKQALAETEEELIDKTKKVAENQEDINDDLPETIKNTDAYSASNQVLSMALKEAASALGVENTQVIKAITGVRTIDAVKKGLTLTTKELTTAQKVLAVTGIMAVITAVGTAIYYIKQWYDEQNKVNKLQKELNDELSRSSSVGKQITKIKELKTEWEKLGDSLKGKEKYIDDNKQKFEDLGVAINDVKDVENLLIENTDAFIQALKMKAKATAAYELASKAYEEQLEKEREAEIQLTKAPTLGDKWNAEVSQFNAGFSRLLSPLGMIEKEWDVAEGYRNKRVKGIVEESKEAQKLGDSYFDVAEKYTHAQKSIFDKLGLTPSDNKPKPPKPDSSDRTFTTLEKKSYDYQKRIDNARVRAIHEGAEQERAAIKAEYDATQAYIQKEMSQLEAIEKKTGKPATAQRAKLFELDLESTRQYEHQLATINANSKRTLNSLFAEVNTRFSSELDNNLAEIKSYYAEVIKEAKKADENVDITPFIEAQKKEEERAHIDDQLRQADFDEMLAMEKANNLASVGMTAIAEEAKLEIVKKYLKERIELLRKRGDEEANREADILEKRLKGFKSSPKSITNLVNSALYKKISKGYEQMGMSADDAEDKTTALFDSVEKGGATASAVVNEVKKMFGGLNEEFDIAIDSLGSIAEGFATGGITGGAMAVVAQGIQMFAHAAQIEKEHQEALKQLALAKLEMQREYNRLLLQEQLQYKEGSNIFGADQIRGAVNAITTYRETIKQFKNELKGEAPKLNPFAMFQKGGIEDYKKQLKAYQDGIGALANVDIVTGSRKSGWGFWKKRKDVYSGLLDTYDDVIDKEGKLNTNRIQAILNTHKMSDENKALLESLLSLDEAAKEAEEQLREYLTETFGGLGNALSDSIVTAFHNGEDAAMLFKDNVSDVLNDLSKQMVFSLFLKKTFDKLDKDIEDAYKDLASEQINEKQLSDKITNILGGFFGGLDGDIAKANDFLESFWQNAENSGFDRPDGERQGAKGGLANASQDSINELTGGVYAVRQIVGDIRNDNREMLLVQQTFANQIGLLVERSEYWEFLEELTDIKDTLVSMKDYGMKMKP